MKQVSMLVSALASLSVPSLALKFAASSQASPVDQVVKLLTDLKSSVEADGTADQTSYDKFACWCEDTLAKKAQDITTAKDSIEELQVKLIKLKGELGSHGAEIAQLEKDINANIESQKEAGAIREKEAVSFEAEKTESEQCLGALEAAIKVLDSAGTKKGFLETLQQAQLLSVVAGVRGLLRRPVVEKSVAEQDLQVVQRFVERPEDFVGGRSMSAIQFANNPFGDYAPRSTQIQGILKTMHDTFTSDLKASTSEEVLKQTGFGELMKTKQSELTTLKATHKSHTTDKATKNKAVADDKVELEDTQNQLKADEVFFSESKLSCQEKAGVWAQRTRMRTEELAGIAQAVAILTSPEAKKTFEDASTTFMQLATSTSGVRHRAYTQLKNLAQKFKSIRIAELALRVKGGHFGEIITVIDNMIARLHDEGAQDIEERDWCEGKQRKNTNDMEDLNSAIGKADKSKLRLDDEVKALDAKLLALEGDLGTTEQNLKELKDMRIAEQKAFVQGVKDDTNAVKLLETAIAHLAKYYQKNPASLVQSFDAPPETSWSGSYNKREGEGKGIVAILTLIKEDLGKEIKMSRKEDGNAQANYESDSKALRDSLTAQTKLKNELEKDKADLGLKIADLLELKSMKNDDLGEEKKKEISLGLNCDWVKTHFKSRRDNRKKEIDGLVDAKNFLAGVDSE